MIFLSQLYLAWVNPTYWHCPPPTKVEHKWYNCDSLSKVNAEGQLQRSKEWFEDCQLHKGGEPKAIVCRQCKSFSHPCGNGVRNSGVEPCHTILTAFKLSHSMIYLCSRWEEDLNLIHLHLLCLLNSPDPALWKESPCTLSVSSSIHQTVSPIRSRCGCRRRSTR